VKRKGGVEKTSAHRQTVAYANTYRADGRVEAILPEAACPVAGHHQG
jgi:hypothetical protein